MMKRKILAIAVVFGCIITCIAATFADVNGKWTGIVSVDGNNYTENFAFRVDGDKLTGTTYQDQDDPRPINEGKVNGTDLIFSVSNKDGETFPFKGHYFSQGDSISLSTDYEGKKLHLTLKRAVGN